MAALVAGKSQQDDPLALISEEGRNAVLAHVRCHCDSIQVHFLEEGTCIHGTGIAYVTTLGIGDDELVGVVLPQIGNGLLKGYPALDTHALIECKVGFIGYAVRCCSIDNGLVEGKHGIFFLQQVGGNLLEIRIKAHTEETSFPLDTGYEFFSGHNSDSFKRSAFSATMRWSMQSCICPSIKAGKLYMV